MSLTVPLDFNTTCRLCLSQEGLLPLFSDIESPEEISISLPRKILACLSIEVSPESNLPKSICEVCKKSIDDWVIFKEQCDRVNSTLLQFVESQNSIEFVEILQIEDDNQPVKDEGDDYISDREEQKESPRKARSSVEAEKEDSPIDTNKIITRCKKAVRKTPNRRAKRELKTAKDQDASEIDDPNEVSDDNNESSNSEKNKAKWKAMYDRYQKKRYVCGVNGCEKVFSRFCDLLKHDLSDHADVPLELTCDFCAKIFISDDRLKVHLNTYHAERKFSCDVCGDKFLTKDSLRSHKRKHSGKFVCKYCGLAANSNMALIEHTRTHTGERPFICDICGQKHSTKNGLNAHKRGHTKEHLFKCNICGYSCANQSSMYMHKATHSLDKPYICETCGKRFKLPVRLAEHKKIHTGIKNFVCEECEMSFLTRYQLMQHYRVHSGEKPYECSICQKRFARQDNLREHTRTHTREKRYTCPKCLKAFSFRKSLNKHSCPPLQEIGVTAYEESSNGVVMYCQL